MGIAAFFILAAFIIFGGFEMVKLVLLALTVIGICVSSMAIGKAVFRL